MQSPGSEPERDLSWSACQLSHSCVLRALLPAPPPNPGSALLCGPGEVQGLLFHMLQLVRDRNSSSALMTLGPALLSAVGGKG